MYFSREAAGVAESVLRFFVLGSRHRRVQLASQGTVLRYFSVRQRHHRVQFKDILRSGLGSGHRRVQFYDLFLLGSGRRRVQF